MKIKPRKGSSSKHASLIKRNGHKNERRYAKLIGGEPVTGQEKRDVIDKAGNFHSVKSGKKWQILLYSLDRIKKGKHINCLTDCLEAFPKDEKKYFYDRQICIGYKKSYQKKNGKDALKKLTNKELVKKIKSPNLFVNSKNKLSSATKVVCKKLQNKDFLKKFLKESIFNNNEVLYLAATKFDKTLMIFHREDVLNVFTKYLIPQRSKAGKVPVDYNVEGQKSLLVYEKAPLKFKNLGEIEIRNDGKSYRRVRFNMYGEDAMILLTKYIKKSKKIASKLICYGKATETFSV